MSVTAKVIIPAKLAESAQTAQYTAPTGTRCIIDKFTATNTSAAAASLSVHLVTAADSAGAANRIVQTKGLAVGESYTFPEIVGHVLESGGFVSTLASAASAITIRASGREVT